MSLKLTALTRCFLQEIGEQLVPGVCEHTLRMELHPLHVGIVPMPQTHHHAVGKPRGDFEAIRQAVSICHQAVITGGCEGLGEACKHSFTVMQNR